MGVTPQQSRRRAFALVEVLVVLGILVVLMTLVIPVVSAARRQADAAGCMSNLRQWGQAAHLYAMENNGFLPRRGQGVQPTSQIARPEDWFNALPPMMQVQPYMELAAAGAVPKPGNGGKSVWVCPAASDFSGANYWSYGMSMGLSVWDSKQNAGRPDSLSTVGDAATMVFLADAPGDHCSVYPSKTPGGYNPVARHNGSVNICFVDGYVAAVAGSYIGIGTGMIERADVRWHPPASTWDGAQ